MPTDKTLEQFKFLMNQLLEGGNPMASYTVEYITQGGGYCMTTIGTSSLSELVEMIIDTNVHKSKNVGRMLLDPIEPGVQKRLQLTNYSRLP